MREIGFVLGLFAAAMLMAGTALALEPDEKYQALENKGSGRIADSNPISLPYLASKHS